MSHPRATYPPGIIGHYHTHGGKKTAAAYRTSWESLRRYLEDQGVTIRPQGLRLGQTLRAKS